jgi:hypothetical protein
MKFAPDLLEVLENTDAPPTVEWFKTVPAFQNGITTNNQRWAVYVMVLEKAGCRCKVYIRSATDAKDGIQPRATAYERLDNSMAKYVMQAIDDGYSITSKGLPAWCDSPAEHASVRTLYHVFEAFFTFAFWAMHDSDFGNGYGMGEMCLRTGTLSRTTVSVHTIPSTSISQATMVCRRLSCPSNQPKRRWRPWRFAGTTSRKHAAV